MMMNKPVENHRTVGGIRAVKMAPGVFVIALALICSTATTAFAQYQIERGQTVFQRPRPDFDPLGIKVGGFTFHPSLDVVQTYNDNVFASNNNKEDDFFTTARLGGTLESDWSRHQLNVAAYGSIDRYWDTTSEDSEEWGVSLGTRADLSSRDTLRTSVRFDQIIVGRGDPENTANDEPEELNRTAAVLGYQHRFNRIAIGILGTVARSDYGASDDRDQDRVEGRVAPRVSYVPSPNVSFFVEPFFATRQYDRRQDFGGLERDANEIGAFIGSQYDITGIITGETSIGYYTVSYDDSRVDDANGLAIRSSTNWNITALTTIIGRVSREDVATTSLNSPSKTSTRLGVAVEHELLRNVELRGGARYENEDFEDINRTDEYYTLEFGANYLLNRNFRLGADYVFRQRDAEVPNDDYIQNRFMVTLRAVL